VKIKLYFIYISPTTTTTEAFMDSKVLVSINLINSALSN